MVAAAALRGFLDPFDAISPIDYRYWEAETAHYLSERSRYRYLGEFETALADEFAAQGHGSQAIADEIRAACAKMDLAAIYYIEKQFTKHDIRAMVRWIMEQVSDAAKRFVHLAATSYDPLDTANAKRFGEFIDNVQIPRMLKLIVVLRGLADRYKLDGQAGRTHGQHGSPITFGFMIAGYIDRLCRAMENLKRLRLDLRGKFSGAVGVHSASKLIVDDPLAFEAAVLKRCGVEPAVITTQIVPPEAMARVLNEFVLIAGIQADLANDMRQLQRSEIAEIGKKPGAEQDGSSTMTYKENPIDYENVVSMWKNVLGRMVTVYLDCVSEHQRDLTNSASGRAFPEIAAYVAYSTRRLTEAMETLVVVHDNVERNLHMSGHLIGGEPLYIVLAALGHPKAHTCSKDLSRMARQSGRNVWDHAREDASLHPYLQQMSPEQVDAIREPTKYYFGIAPQLVERVLALWQHLHSLPPVEDE